MNDSDPRKNDNLTSDPLTWVDQYGDFLYSYALKRVQDIQIAQDLVQEAFLAALNASNNFEGRSLERTWLTGILKHKIIDHFRLKSKEQPIEDMDFSAESLEDLFDQSGKWKIGPEKWAINPADIVDRKEFWKVFYRCLSDLPKRMAEIFVQREIDRLKTDELCKVFGISSTNCWVILHRARAFLRRCFEINWFGSEKSGKQDESLDV